MRRAEKERSERTGASPCPVVSFRRPGSAQHDPEKKRNLTRAGSVRAAAQVPGNGGLGGPTQPLHPTNGAQYFCATKSTPAMRSAAVERSGRVCTGTLCVDLTLTTQSQERARAPRPRFLFVSSRESQPRGRVSAQLALKAYPPRKARRNLRAPNKVHANPERGPFNDEAPRKICYKERLTD